MSSFRVQIAGENNVLQILQLVREFAEALGESELCTVTEKRLHELMFGESPLVEALIALHHKDKAIGYALFFQNYASFRGQRGIFLEDLYVVPEMRQLGVGRTMMKRLAQIAHSRRCQRLDWLVLKQNRLAIEFYEKLGAKLDSNERHVRLVDENFERLANADG